MADTKISDLTTASALDGTELLLLSQGAADRKVDLDTFRDELYWARPSDWPAMPADAANKVSILAAVWDHSSNFCALTCNVSSGTYDVDWGDGSTSTGVTSGSAATHTYDYSDVDLGSLTSRGYKTAMIVVTPNTGGANFTTVNLSTAATPAGNPWLDVLANIPSCTSFAVGVSGQTNSPYVERVRVTAISSSITSLANCFWDCRNLKAVSFPAGFAGAITTIANMFDRCRSIEVVDFRGWGFDASLVNSSGCFQFCVGLQRVLYDSGMFDAVTNASSMFMQCSTIRSITINLPAATNISSFALSCVSLSRLEFTALGAVTTIASITSGCDILAELIFPSGFGSSITTTTTAFSTNTKLARMVNAAIPVSFSIASCKFAAAQLDAIYTALPTVTSQTITVSGNHGTTGDDPTIATAKGWTVTG